MLSFLSLLEMSGDCPPRLRRPHPTAMRRGIVSALPCRACWKERNDTLFGSTRLNFPSHTERIRAAPLPFCACPSLSDSAHVIAFPWPSDADLCRFIFLRAYSDAWMLCAHPSLAFAMQVALIQRCAVAFRGLSLHCRFSAVESPRRHAISLHFSSGPSLGLSLPG